ncbi:trehalose-phosphatase [Candidatus Micrarchaeota archaeon]|nr:trehalose-phosphatase [Candidatus Micrarchaeota archaeon]
MPASFFSALPLLRKKWRRRRRLVILDFDGVLVPIRKNPAAPRLAASMKRALMKLRDSGASVWVLTSRDASFMNKRFHIRGIRVIPERGAHWNPIFSRQNASIRRMISQLERVLKPLARSFPGSLIERKPSSLVFHYRNVALSRQAALIQSIHSLSFTSSLQKVPGRKSFEWIPRGLPDKGVTVRRIGASERAFPIYVGDDSTDEPAFLAVKRNGIGVLVRSSEKNFRTTNARYYVNGIRDVDRLLHSLAR